MTWKKGKKKKHFTILDSVVVSNMFLAFFPSMEGFPHPSSSERSVFYYILVWDILIKMYFFVLARILILNIDRIIE